MRYFGFLDDARKTQIPDSIVLYQLESGNDAPVIERDAPHVLDEILTNETELTIIEHTTDTHGYSDLIFAFFELTNKRLFQGFAILKINACVR